MATVTIFYQENKGVPLQVFAMFRNYNVLTSLEDIRDYKDEYWKRNDIVFTVPADVEEEVLKDLAEFSDSIAYRVE